MAFMTPEYEYGRFVTIEALSIYCCPLEYVDWPTIQEAVAKGKDLFIESQKGWYWRLSASGYLDCTDWTGPFDTEQEARKDCQETHDIDPDTGDELEYTGEFEDEEEIK